MLSVLIRCEAKLFMSAVSATGCGSVSVRGQAPCLRHWPVCNHGSCCGPEGPLLLPDRTTKSLFQSEGIVPDYHTTVNTICNPRITSIALNRYVVHNCSKYLTKRALRPFMFDTRQPSNIWIALTWKGDWIGDSAGLGKQIGSHLHLKGPRLS